MGKLADWLTRHIWFRVLWMIRRPWMRRLQLLPLCIVPPSRRPQFLRRMAAENAFALRWGRQIIRIIILTVLALIVLRLGWIAAERFVRPLTAYDSQSAAASRPAN